MRKVNITCIFLLISFSIHAEEIRLTLYDDGRSCPGNCDSHVVFHASLNGTEFAHSPTTKIAPFRHCTSGTQCRVCLASGLKQCIEVMYRGGGPSPKTLDLTPAFFLERCPQSTTLPVLQKKCEELRLAAKLLDGRVNCFKETENTTCKSIMARAQKAKEDDQTLYDECQNVGEARFNASQPKKKQRSLSCAYEKYGTGGPNSKGNTWRRLLPAACRPGTYVGRDGLDCCNGTPSSDGPLLRECRSFYIAIH